AAQHEEPGGEHTERRVDEDQPRTTPALRLVTALRVDHGHGEEPEGRAEEEGGSDPPRGVPPRHPVRAALLAVLGAVMRRRHGPTVGPAPPLGTPSRGGGRWAGIRRKS